MKHSVCKTFARISDDAVAAWPGLHPTYIELEIIGMKLCHDLQQMNSKSAELNRLKLRLQHRSCVMSTM